MTYGVVDGRDYLRAPYSGRHQYPGYCLGVSPISVPLSLVVQNARLGEREQVLALAEVLKGEYQKQRGYRDLVAIAPQQVEMLLGGMLKGAT